MELPSRCKSNIPDFYLKPWSNILDSYDCNGTPAQNFVLNKGSTKVQVSGTGFCLDAGISTHMPSPSRVNH